MLVDPAPDLVERVHVGEYLDEHFGMLSREFQELFLECSIRYAHVPSDESLQQHHEFGADAFSERRLPCLPLAGALDGLQICQPSHVSTSTRESLGP